MPPRKIISGGQTGADQAGLEAGYRLGLVTGGWIPRGFRTDDGPMPKEMAEKYCLVEHPASRYPPRTWQNVRDSDGTALFGNMDSPGCRLTLKYCEELRKPHITNPSSEELRAWAEQHEIGVLNVAGNRERTNPGIAIRVADLIVDAFMGVGDYV